MVFTTLNKGNLPEAAHEKRAKDTDNFLVTVGEVISVTQI
jgi:hypothetical protein